MPSTCRAISTATTLMKSKDENTKTPIAFCSLATNLDQASFEETTTPSCQSISYDPLNTSDQPSRWKNPECRNHWYHPQHGTLSRYSNPTTPNQPFAKSFSLDPTQVKEALGRVKSHLSDEGIWKIIESQPAPIRDIIIWFCDQMNLAHLGHKQRERALRKYTDIKDGDFYIARSINVNVSLNKSSNLAESKEAEAEILGFANTLDTFQRGASEHMHTMAKLEQTAARKKIVETCAGLSLQLIWRLVDYTTSTTGHTLNKSLPMTARQFTKLYITTLESTSEYCSNYLHSSSRTVADILTRLVLNPPETTSRTTTKTLRMKRRIKRTKAPTEKKLQV